MLHKICRKCNKSEAKHWYNNVAVCLGCKNDAIISDAVGACVATGAAIDAAKERLRNASDREKYGEAIREIYFHEKELKLQIEFITELNYAAIAGKDLAEYTRQKEYEARRPQFRRTEFTPKSRRRQQEFA